MALGLSKLNVKKPGLLLNQVLYLGFIMNTSFIGILQISVHLPMCWQFICLYSRDVEVIGSIKAYHVCVYMRK